MYSPTSKKWKEKLPSSLVTVDCGPPIRLSDEIVTWTPASGPSWSSTTFPSRRLLVAASTEPAAKRNAARTIHRNNRYHIGHPLRFGFVAAFTGRSYVNGRGLVDLFVSM